MSDKHNIRNTVSIEWDTKPEDVNIEFDSKSKSEKRNPTYHYVKVEKKIDGIPESAAKYPEHFVKIALIVKNNAEIRRFTSLGIIEYLRQTQTISPDAKAHVEYQWNKFTVSSKGLRTDYRYSQPFFINSLVASFSNFANSAKIAIEEFIEKELPDISNKDEIIWTKM